mmetsp:Transcript_79092/g.183519  ORF Transcript_79092/g.183519 Transcript_79092/m.183519 type:complete len:175 (-) Transcript_79092:106-630(-)
MRHIAIENVRAALESVDDGPLLRFLREVFLCTDISTSEWYDSQGLRVLQSSYTIPVPRDIPEVAARLLRVPETICCTTVWYVQSQVGEVVLVQNSSTKDVLYGERFKLKNTMSFREDAAGGGIAVNAWTDVVWSAPLPWTHAVIKHVIEKKAKSDSAAVVGQLVKMIEDVAVAK